MSISQTVGLIKEIVAHDYSVVVYVDGTKIIAKDKKGTIISSGTAGTDDSTVVQAAIDSLATNGGEVVLNSPVTNIRPSTSIIINKSKISIRATNGTIIKPTANITPIKIVCPAGKTNMNRGRIHHTSLHDLWFNCYDNQTEPQILVSATDWGGLKDIQIYNIHMLNTYSGNNGETGRGATYTGIKFDFQCTNYTTTVDVANNHLDLENAFTQGFCLICVDPGSVTGITAGTWYYIRQVTATDFKLATTDSDSTIVTLGGTGTASFKAGSSWAIGTKVHDIFMDICGKGFDFNFTSDAWMNGAQFTNIYLNGAVTGFDLTNDHNGASTFHDIQIQPIHWTYTVTVDVAGNHFNHTNYFLEGTRLFCENASSVTGIITGQSYYVRQVTGTDYKLATTNDDGTIVTLGGSGTATLEWAADYGFKNMGVNGSSAQQFTNVFVWDWDADAMFAAYHIADGAENLKIYTQNVISELSNYVVYAGDVGNTINVHVFGAEQYDNKYKEILTVGRKSCDFTSLSDAFLHATAPAWGLPSATNRKLIWVVGDVDENNHTFTGTVDVANNHIDHANAFVDGYAVYVKDAKSITGIRTGEIYYARQCTATDFKLGTTNDDLNLITLGGTGTADFANGYVEDLWMSSYVDIKGDGTAVVNVNSTGRYISIGGTVECKFEGITINYKNNMSTATDLMQIDYNTNTETIFRNCTFNILSDKNPQGFKCKSGTATFENCTFNYPSKTACANLMYIYNDCYPVFKNCKFTISRSSGTGSRCVAYTVIAAPKFYDCEFIVNTEDFVAPVDVANNHFDFINYMSNGNYVTCVSAGSVTGITTGSNYYVRQKADTTFKLATTNSDATIVTLGGTGNATFRQSNSDNKAISGWGGYAIFKNCIVTSNGTGLTCQPLSIIGPGPSRFIDCYFKSNTSSNAMYIDDDAMSLTRTISDPANINTDTDTFTFTNHYFCNGLKVKYTAGGATIAGLTDGAYYYIVNANVSTTFQLASTLGGIAINLTDKTGVTSAAFTAYAQWEMNNCTIEAGNVASYYSISCETAQTGVPIYNCTLIGPTSNITTYDTANRVSVVANSGSMAMYDAVVYIEGTKVVAKNRYGTIITSGTAATDDSAVIQAAIDAVTATGGICYIKQGTYNITATLTMKHWMTLQGEHQRKTILKAAADVDIMTTVSPGTTYSFNIKDIHFNGNNRTYTSGGLMMLTVDDVYIERCHFDSIAGNGLSMLDATTITIRDCDFYHCGHVANTKAALQFGGSASGPVTNCKISGCHFPGSYYMDIYSPEYLEGCQIEGCWMESESLEGATQPSAAKISLQGTAGTNKNVSIRNCRLRENGNGTAMFIDARGQLDFECSHNYMTASAPQTHLQPFYFHCSGAVFTNNTFGVDNVGVSGTQIYFGSPNNILFSANVVTASGFYALQAADANDFQIIGNTFGGAAHYTILFQSVNNGVVMIGNNIGNGGWSSLQTTNTVNGYIVGNRFTTTNLTASTSCIIEGNVGYVTKNSGTGTVTAASTYVDVTHGLGTTPTKFHITWQDNIGTRNYWVDNVGATTFRVNFDTQDTVNHIFYWTGEV